MDRDLEGKGVLEEFAEGIGAKVSWDGMCGFMEIGRTDVARAVGGSVEGIKDETPGSATDVTDCSSPV